MNTKKLRLFTAFILLCGLIGTGSFLVKVMAQEDFRVTEVFLKADDAKPTGKCPLLVKFNGYITANGKGTVKYTFTRSDGATSPVYTLDFKEAGTQTVSTDWTLGDAAALPRYEGWQAIKILSPNEMESSHTTGSFAINCVGARTNSFLYVIREEDASCNQIYGFSVNETTGALTPIVGFPIATGGNGSYTGLSEQITIDRANNRLFVINVGSRTVSAYSINPTTGALTALPFSPISLGLGFYTTIAVHPTGSPLVVGDGDPSPSVRSYAITATTATEAPGSPYSTGSVDARPFSSVFSRSGGFYYTGGNNGASFAGFSVAAGSGVLTPLAGSPFSSGGSSATAYATDTQGRLFIANYPVDVFRLFTTAGGIPSGVSGNPFASGLAEPIDGVLHPNEQFYFVADDGANQIGSYRIGGTGAATTLTAVAGSPFSSGGLFTNSLVTNQAGTFLFATNGHTRNLTSYSVNPTTGVLANIGVQPANMLGSSGVLTGIAYYAP